MLPGGRRVFRLSHEHRLMLLASRVLSLGIPGYERRLFSRQFKEPFQNEDESSGDCDYVCWNSLESASNNATANANRGACTNATCGARTGATRRITTPTEERDQESGGVQRLRRSTATDGSDRQDQRSGSFPHSVPQQRDEGRRAGNTDGSLPADQQPGQSDGRREPVVGG